MTGFTPVFQQFHSGPDSQAAKMLCAAHIKFEAVFKYPGLPNLKKKVPVYGFFLAKLCLCRTFIYP